MDKEKYIPPLKAIRLKCLDCVCGNAYEVRNCTGSDCPLYFYRFGKNPFLKREYTEEQKQEIAERLKTARETTQK